MQLYNCAPFKSNSSKKTHHKTGTFGGIIDSRKKIKSQANLGQVQGESCILLPSVALQMPDCSQ